MAQRGLQSRDGICTPVYMGVCMCVVRHDVLLALLPTLLLALLLAILVALLHIY